MLAKVVVCCTAVAAVLLAGCPHPAEYRTLLPPTDDGPDFNEYIVEHYQADVDQTFEAAESQGLGTFTRIRLELDVAPDGRVTGARRAVSENWNMVLLEMLRPRMKEWRLPAEGRACTCVVEVVRSPESLRARKRDFRIEL